MTKWNPQRGGRSYDTIKNLTLVSFTLCAPSQLHYIMDHFVNLKYLYVDIAKKVEESFYWSINQINQNDLQQFFQHISRNNIEFHLISHENDTTSTIQALHLFGMWAKAKKFGLVINTSNYEVLMSLFTLQVDCDIGLRIHVRMYHLSEPATNQFLK